MYPCKQCGSNNWEIDSTDLEMMRATCVGCDNLKTWKKTVLTKEEKRAWAEEHNLNKQDK